MNWQISATTTSATFNGIVGHQYVFRSRGVDWAQNAEDWPLSEDTQATLYAWGITGHIYDNTGVPVSNAVITITPTAAEVFTSNAMGAYAAYVLTDTTPYTTTWEKNGYGSLPATGFGSHIDGNLAVYLPPVDNIILNGDFEMDDLATSGWTAAGEITPTLTDTLKLTGQQSIVLGTVLSQTGDSVITQVVTLPPTLAAPTLSFVYQPVSESSLTKNLVAYWKLDETSGTRIDATGRGNDLADNNTVASSPGKVGAAAQFVAANSEYLYCADTADLSTGDIDFTFAAWVYLDAPQTNGVFIGKGNADSSSMFEYLGGYNINDGMAVTMSSNTNTGDLSASAFGTPSLSQWYFVVAWHDAGNNQIGISVNGATNLLSYSSGLWDSTQSFFIGSDGGGRYWNGRVDEVGIWKRVLTADERDILYNGGQGCTYPFTTCGLFTPTQSLAAPSQFTISIDDGVTTTIVFSDAIGSTTKWTQQWVDISTWASQTVTITFGAEKGFGLAELVYIDDISLGSAHPDVWTQLESPQTIPPGSLATFSLTYGNQGGAPASGVLLTATLPSEFIFVDASLPPITTTPALVWDAGTLAGKSGPYSIVITATVSPTAPTFVNVISQSDVATSSDELETANNVSQGNTFIGHRIYLPLIAR